jgi:hypothetical protein
VTDNSSDQFVWNLPEKGCFIKITPIITPILT